MRKRALEGVIVTALSLALIAGPVTRANASTSYPVIYDSAVAAAVAVANPGGSPPAANDWSCQPGPAHPRPVVLVHGTFANMAVTWNALSPLLKNEGYCIFALNFGGLIAGQIGGTRDIAASAAELGDFVDRVLAATGATTVDMVGHSQGGMMPRYYLGPLGGAAKVANLVALAPSNHGTTLSGLATLGTLFPWALDIVGLACAACTQQVLGSPFLTTLNQGGDTVPGVRYTVIQTKYDQVVTPYTSAFLAGSTVTNIRLQDQCGLDLSEHLAVIYDRIALRDVLNALDPEHAVPPACVPIAPILGG
jgi:triacylglycerol esterase/lipase EstA (alpha/beta hydrolase family)